MVLRWESSNQYFLAVTVSKAGMVGIGTLIVAIAFVLAMVVTLGLLLRLLKDADGP